MPAAAPRMSRAQREERILETAARLFYARGVRGVGMDELIRATGLSKMSVYRVFPTKDELAGAVLRRRAGTILDLIDAEIAASPDDPRPPLVAIVEAVARDTARDDFRGCPFNNASAEFDDPGHPARRAALAYKVALRERLVALSERLAPGRGEALGDRLAVIIDGMYLSAGILGPGGPARSGRALALALIDAAGEAQGA